MPTFTLKAAAAQFPKLIARAEAGEEIVIVRGAKPVAMIVAVQSKPKGKRQFGRLKRLGKVDPEFFEPLPEEELKLWEGDS
jgi:antitoxin (DNA-binding transcriptional repressor) of toxin-antitoxin stability system